MIRVLILLGILCILTGILFAIYSIGRQIDGEMIIIMLIMAGAFILFVVEPDARFRENVEEYCKDRGFYGMNTTWSNMTGKMCNCLHDPTEADYNLTLEIGNRSLTKWIVGRHNEQKEIQRIEKLRKEVTS